jgi:hypothetical protein
LPFAEKLNTPCYIHAYIDTKDNVKKSTHLLRDYRQLLDLQKIYESFNPGAKVQAYPMIQGAQPPNPPPAPRHQVQQVQPRTPNEAFPPPPPQGQMSMIH